ncbi:MAG: restriction endonuclease subunit S [Candidatus Gracilibacteria bacterium]|nr:restriction endonuclease subunit S [Candidatus Gracilibacteria bacterium]
MQLPKNWRIKKLSEIGIIFNGNSINEQVKKEKYLGLKEGFSFVATKDVDFKTHTIDYDNGVKIPFSEKVFKVAHKNSVLICSEGGNAGKKIAFNTEDICFGNKLLAIETGKDIEPKFVYYWYLTGDFFKNFKSQMNGIIGGISIKNFKNLEIPVPPLPTQHLIVSEIEKQFSRLDDGLSSLLKIRQNLKSYRGSILKSAIEGRLTEEWRKEQKNIEPASILLARILEERKRKFLSENPGKKYKEPEELEKNNIGFDVPYGWQWVNLGQITWSVKDGPHYSPKYVDEGIPFITGGNVRQTGVDFVNCKFISQELHEELNRRCKSRKGDILYTKGGTTGIARVNTYDLDFSVWVHVAVLKLIESANPFYIQYILNSSYCYSQSQKFTHGVGNQDLGLTRMIKINFPLPPLTEQQKIVEEVEYRLSIVDELEQTIEVGIKKAENLKQAVLKKAFSGELINS